MLCELCKVREATNLTKFKKGIPSHMGAKLEAQMNLCDECREKVKGKAIEFSTVDTLETFFEKKKKK